MSAKSASTVLLRQWLMLRRIPRYPQKVSVREIHDMLAREGTEISMRSLERDLHELSRLFPLTCDARDKPYGWSWMKNAATLDIPGLTLSQALTFALVERQLGSMLPASVLADLKPYFEMARQRLVEHARAAGTRPWTDKVRNVLPTQPLLAPKARAETREAVVEALLNEERLTLRYRPRGSESAKTYEASPLALVQRGPITYLVCAFFNYSDVRMLALHRIESAERLDKKASVPPGFSLDAEIRKGLFEFGDGSTIKVELLFDEGAGAHLYETPLSTDQQIEEDAEGNLRVRATVLDTQQLRWWLLGFGDGVEVVKPAKLRKEFREMARGMAGIYE